MLSYKRCFCLMFLVYALIGCTKGRFTSVPIVKTHSVASPSFKKNVKGVWFTTLSGLDWPSPDLNDKLSDECRITIQKKTLTDKLDNLMQLGVNTVFFQVKPDGTVLYRSALLPWSDVLTGVVGKDPGYDPFAFLISEGHKRGLKIHAWLNPYRVTNNIQPQTITTLQRTIENSPSSVYALHPKWIRTASDQLVLDPGLPDVREWIANVVIELLNKYSVDGIHFDDYFYYETPSSRLQDDTTYYQYGQKFFTKKDWRRYNTLLLIEKISKIIKLIKPQVEFGISPIGVWRNAENDVRGSDTHGVAAYDIAYADTRLWVKRGLIDYIVPQIYWPFSRTLVRYDILVKWWSSVVKQTKTRLYIGIALYKVGLPSKNEPDWMKDGGVSELQHQLNFNDAIPEVQGSVLFREAFLHQSQTKLAVEYIKTHWSK